MSEGDAKRDRGERLAEALRENLRRRKAQARSRRETEPEGADGAGPERNGRGEAAEDGRRE